MKYLMACLISLISSTTYADERFLPYIEWLVANSDYQYNGEELPTIRHLPYPWLEVTVYGPENVARAEANGSTLPKIKGAYNPETNEMLFEEGVDPWAQEDTVVHELYHFLQHVNGVTDECVPNLERPAYEAHWKWVEEHGLTDVYEEPNWLFVFMLSLACTDPHHYR